MSTEWADPDPSNTPVPKASSRSGDGEPARPLFGEALKFWFKLGWISFGGPTGQIAILHTELVERRRWIREDRFLHALNYCMLLPGPEAQQLATYSGWLLHGTRGALAGGILFVAPSVVLLWLLSWIYGTQGTVPAVAAVFDGLKGAVLAIVAVAMVRLGRRALGHAARWGLAAAAFAALYVLDLPFPAVLLGAAFLGWWGGRHRPDWFGAAGNQAPPEPHHGERPEAEGVGRPAKGWSHARRVVLIGAVVWWVPVGLVGWALGWEHTLFQEGLFFSKVALVTFGGAYAVLPYVAQRAVEHHGWLEPGQMMDGLGLAETTPGPLVMVLQFVGFMGGWQHPGTLPPMLAATMGAAITTWVTFVPCFIWVLAGAPHVERLQGIPALAHAMGGVTSAVVGVMLNLAVWFGWHVLVPAGQPDLFAAGIALTCGVGLAIWRWNVVWVVLGAGLAGWIRHLWAG